MPILFPFSSPTFFSYQDRHVAQLRLDTEQRVSRTARAEADQARVDARTLAIQLQQAEREARERAAEVAELRQVRNCWPQQRWCCRVHAHALHVTKYS